ncbi:MAG TPA: hypothetical protein VF980_01330 [Thermoanaerobaculia bacterium]
MNVQRTGPTSFLAQFDDEQELRDEHKSNLSFGALRLVTTETAAPDTALQITLRGPSGGETTVPAKVVAALKDGIALAIDGNGDEILARLLAAPASTDDQDKMQTSWDRVRALSQNEKMLLAVKADRSERATLLQDNDPRVLLSLLRNPRLTVDEVVRLAKSSFLNYQIADVIMKTAQWLASIDVRLGLIHNPKTPQAFALRILPTLPEADVRAIARSGTSMALKQAALRKLQGK